VRDQRAISKARRLVDEKSMRDDVWKDRTRVAHDQDIRLDATNANEASVPMPNLGLSSP